MKTYLRHMYMYMSIDTVYVRMYVHTYVASVFMYVCTAGILLVLEVLCMRVCMLHV